MTQNRALHLAALMNYHLPETENLLEMKVEKLTLKHMTKAAGVPGL